MSKDRETNGSGEPQRIATLREGERLDGVFACVRKERSISKSGSPYLTVELRDATGSVVGRAFRDADVLSGRFERGDAIRVKGRVERFRDALQATIDSIAKAELGEGEMRRFLPSSKQDPDELEGFLEHLTREIYEKGLRSLCERVLSQREVREGLRVAPCGIPGESGRGGIRHHAYLGGLLEHTVAVTTMAVELCSVHPRLDRDLLICASILHDIGRTKEFTYGSEVGRTEEGRLLGHVELGLRLIGDAAGRGGGRGGGRAAGGGAEPAAGRGVGRGAERAVGRGVGRGAERAVGRGVGRGVEHAIERGRLLALEHCVSTHHGGDGGSDLRPSSPEAVALFRLNALDAGVKGALERGLA